MTKFELLRQETEKIEISLQSLGCPPEYIEMILGGIEESYWAWNEYDGPVEPEDDFKAFGYSPSDDYYPRRNQVLGFE